VQLAKYGAETEMEFSGKGSVLMAGLGILDGIGAVDALKITSPLNLSSILLSLHLFVYAQNIRLPFHDRSNIFYLPDPIPSPRIGVEYLLRIRALLRSGWPNIIDT
jgi:hypothetical protein